MNSVITTGLRKNQRPFPSEWIGDPICQPDFEIAFYAEGGRGKQGKRCPGRRR